MMEKAIVRKLLQIKAIKLKPQNPFTWASGIKSPIYCDNRVTLSYPEVRRFIRDCFVKKSKSFTSFDHISGVATAGIAHGAILAEYLDLPFSYVRSKAKGHGQKNKIEGRIPKGSKILVIEDLISTGGSSIAAVTDLRDAGHEVVGVLAIFSYEFLQAKENFKKINCEYATLSNYSSLLLEAKKMNYITDDDLNTLKEWSKNPNGWYQNLGQ